MSRTWKAIEIGSGARSRGERAAYRRLQEPSRLSGVAGRPSSGSRSAPGSGRAAAAPATGAILGTKADQQTVRSELADGVLEGQERIISSDPAARARRRSRPVARARSEAVRPPVPWPCRCPRRSSRVARQRGEMTMISSAASMSDRIATGSRPALAAASPAAISNLGPISARYSLTCTRPATTPGSSARLRGEVTPVPTRDTRPRLGRAGRSWGGAWNGQVHTRRTRSAPGPAFAIVRTGGRVGRAARSELAAPWRLSVAAGLLRCRPRPCRPAVPATPKRDDGPLLQPLRRESSRPGYRSRTGPIGGMAVAALGRLAGARRDQHHRATSRLHQTRRHGAESLRPELEPRPRAPVAMKTRPEVVGRIADDLD